MRFIYLSKFLGLHVRCQETGRKSQKEHDLVRQFILSRQDPFQEFKESVFLGSELARKY